MTKETNETRQALMAQRMETIAKGVEDINTKLDKNYVTKDQKALTDDKLSRLEKIVYGTAAAVLLRYMVDVFGSLQK